MSLPVSILLRKDKYCWFMFEIIFICSDDVIKVVLNFKQLNKIKFYRTHVNLFSEHLLTQCRLILINFVFMWTIFIVKFVIEDGLDQQAYVLSIKCIVHDALRLRTHTQWWVYSYISRRQSIFIKFHWKYLFMI